jgi:Flp pilus assembly protein TadD
MKNTAMMKFAASSLMMGALVVVSSPATSGTSFATPSEAVRIAASAVKKANKAIAKHDFEKAIMFAERAVSFQPKDASYRMLLGQAYLSAGRFASASTSFGDVLTIDPNNSRAALNMALTEVALGHQADALAMLDEHRQVIPAADYGLATALAGDVDGAVRVLEAAVRDVQSSVKARQNLALAYALSGRWPEARVMAAQDLSLELLDTRMTEWASFAKPKAASDQVAALLGVHPAYDPGQPSQLALSVVSNQAVAAAESAPALPVEASALAAPTAEVAKPVEVAAQAEPAPAFETPVVTAAAEPVAAEAPVIRSDPTPLKQAVVPARRAKVTDDGATASRIRPIESGKFAVQLGAFAKLSQAEQGWNRAIHRSSELASYDPSQARVKVKASSFYRLSVSGFASRHDASQVCTTIRRTGMDCFVRSIAGDVVASWVERGSGKLAAR